MPVLWAHRVRARWAVIAFSVLSVALVGRHWKTRAEPRVIPASNTRAVDVPSGDAQPALRVTGAFAALNSVYLLAPRILGSRTGFNRGGDGGLPGGAGLDFNLVLLSLAKPGSRVAAGDV